MFSFAGDTVLDPFAGTGTTAVAAIGAGRNSISCEIESKYLEMANAAVAKEMGKLRLTGVTRLELVEQQATNVRRRTARRA
jgi:site-specific DNA-methyltransferase (adenine-specific)